MSLGLGIDLMLENLDEYLKTDEIWFDGQKYNIPQAVLNKRFNSVERLISKQYQDLKSNRVAKAKSTQNALWEKLRYGDCVYAQKKYRAESKEKRLTKPLA